ncbi:TerC family protein [Rhodococcus rhodnii]|uniref:Tellerium resistance protein n=2 Tax=Rhodococcus rhodnii TaxID=38312 RepID=R7WN73_9NOCA|nr:TerC family protein [Rhodococcus rhodnii]EOM76740.1 tellerium resistance protein [Rhodococcus rhodnii LMG 5362]TXG90073.1 TerC family protein [Rhodococcus rhodnii]
MNVTPLSWIVTVAIIVAALTLDYVVHVKRPHVPTIRESALWSALYVGFALAFGVGVLVFGGAAMAAEYYAGWITEKALSVDNFFVFLVIMGSFKVPRENQEKVLLFGIVFALLARSVFIFVGGALIETFSWMFYLFGLVLLLTAGSMLRGDDEDEGANNVVVRIATRFLRTSPHYDGDRLVTTTRTGARVMTPMLLVMVVIGGTDLMFAFDSIPAIFGLTQSVFLVFAATAFSLMGLKQLYFLLDGLLDRLVYLKYGLAVILAFIGAKLILHALNENSLWFVNDGESVHVVEIGTGTSLLVIVGVLVVTVTVSLASPRGRALSAVNGAARHARSYLDLDYTADESERRRVFEQMCREERKIHALPAKHRELVRRHTDLVATIERAHAVHDESR